MTRPTYIEASCRTALNRVGGMPFQWSLNPYRGCTHACHYCYARATHAYFGMNAGEDFETKIFVKTNVVEVLRAEIHRPAWRGEKIAIGTATDPYQPTEGRYRLTRGCLEVLATRRNPVSLTTKSTLIVRDLDLLSELARQTDVTVHLTLTTVERPLWRLLEPGTPPPEQRLRAMARLVGVGIPCTVFLAPILPGITDSTASLEAVVHAAREHGALAVWPSPLRLAPLVKEHYLGVIAAHFPALLPRYERGYALSANAPGAYQEAIARRVERICLAAGFAGTAQRAGTNVPAIEIDRQARPRQLAFSF